MREETVLQLDGRTIRQLYIDNPKCMRCRGPLPSSTHFCHHYHVDRKNDEWTLWEICEGCSNTHKGNKGSRRTED